MTWREVDLYEFVAWCQGKTIVGAYVSNPKRLYDPHPDDATAVLSDGSVIVVHSDFNVWAGEPREPEFRIGTSDGGGP